jgi:hypothetical protein
MARRTTRSAGKVQPGRPWADHASALVAGLPSSLSCSPSVQPDCAHRFRWAPKAAEQAIRGTRDQGLPGHRSSKTGQPTARERPEPGRRRRCRVRRVSNLAASVAARRPRSRPCAGTRDQGLPGLGPAKQGKRLRAAVGAGAGQGACRSQCWRPWQGAQRRHLPAQAVALRVSAWPGRPHRCRARRVPNPAAPAALMAARPGTHAQPLALLCWASCVPLPGGWSAAI